MSKLAPNGAALDVKGVSKSFGGLQVLVDIDLKLEPRHIVGLIGPNGAGKSTLFNVITSIYKPDIGDIYLCGKKITGSKPHKICRLGIARTFQLVKTFLNLTALDNVLVSAIYGQGLRGRKAQNAALDALELVGMFEKKNRKISSLTLSDRRLLEVARALASKPVVSLLDEPMAGLNPSETMNMLKVINRAREERDLSILWVEHKMEAIFHLCDQVVVLVYGRKIADGTPEEVMKNPEVIEAYLGQPLA